LTKVFKAMFAVLKSFKVLGPLVTLGSMSISIWAYSYSLGWKLASLFILLLLLHELGHVIACRRIGLKASAPLFIPFIGALIFAPNDMDREEESYVGYGGPLLGTIASLFVWMLWWLIPSHPPLLLTASFIGMFLNLFNLIPLHPLDGGRILQSVGRWIQWVGIAILAVITLLMKDPGMLYLWLIVMTDFRFKHRRYWMILVFLIMTTGLLWGLGSEHQTVVYTYIIFGALLCVLAFAVESEGKPIIHRPAQPRKRAWFWFAAYALLAFFLLTSMWFQSKQLEALDITKKEIPAPQVQ